jgi:hypothetical protein
VKINGMPPATLGSTATNTPPRIPIGGTFVNPPTTKATIVKGSAIVMINGEPAARLVIPRSPATTPLRCRPGPWSPSATC